MAEVVILLMVIEIEEFYYLLQHTLFQHDLLGLPEKGQFLQDTQRMLFDRIIFLLILEYLDQIDNQFGLLVDVVDPNVVRRNVIQQSQIASKSYQHLHLNLCGTFKQQGFLYLPVGFGDHADIVDGVVGEDLAAQGRVLGFGESPAQGLEDQECSDLVLGLVGFREVLEDFVDVEGDDGLGGFDDGLARWGERGAGDDGGVGLGLGDGVLLEDGDVFGDEELLDVSVEELGELLYFTLYFVAVLLLVLFVDFFNEFEYVFGEVEPLQLGLHHVGLGYLEDLLVVLLKVVHIHDQRFVLLFH